MNTYIFNMYVLIKALIRLHILMIKLTISLARTINKLRKEFKFTNNYFTLQ